MRVLTFQLKAVLAEEESAKLSNRIKIGLLASALGIRNMWWKRANNPPFSNFSINISRSLYEVSWGLKLILVDPNN